MDKLKPLITHRFWILSALILPMALYGYFSANSAIKAATATREGELQTKLSGVPKGDGANQEYVDKMKIINDGLKAKVEQVVVDLWQRQQERMTWHPIMQGKVPQNFMDVEPATTFTVEAGHAYRNSVYDFVLEDLARSVEPVFPTVEQLTLPKETRQMVILVPDVPRLKLGQLRVEPKDIWAGQIDIWLTQLIFDAIRNMNEDAPTISEAQIRRIEKYYLFGGDGTPVVGAAGMMGMMGGGYEGAGAMSEEAMSGMAMSAMMGSGGGVGAGGPAAIKSSVEFKPSEEFGNDIDPEGAPAASESGGYEGESMGMGMMGMMGGAGMPKLRYIADSEDKKFLERGFYLSVIIKQDQIPEFLAELVAAPWPIRIHRFSIGDNKFRRKDAPGMYGGGMPGMGMMGGGYGPAMASGSYEGGGYGAGAMADMATGGSYEGMADMGYGGMATATVNTKSRFASGVPTWATEALNHPDLVQLDLCGVITMYKQPDSLKTATSEEGAAPAEGATDASPDTSAPVEAGTVESAVPAAESAAVEPAAANPEPAPAIDASPAETVPAETAPVAAPEPAVEAPAADAAAGAGNAAAEGTSPAAETSNPQ